ncbi:class A beta-lactamase, subclass A2 [Mucilaginibacter gotjawali]|uniref:Beta-lactamase class A n=2 Tax=Mucilaginibacter gotjawali TaxID=1550579 RepID=A0A839SL65_9SPHI|nr:class A beta-lactamase, subclass A2 [Mucilaginibacter gotjawali]MBB3059025.1 beta-lactamase class A [Mucilaginibacter gotjawali]BAU55794.1 Extended-spectrum beta-lactamase PER-1 precursor [Mucilaginibacter gotjawali]
MKSFILSAFIAFIFITPAFAQSGKDAALRSRIEELSKPVKGIVGVSILNTETGDTLSYNGKARLVLHSVMKFPIALTVMHLVDSGVYTLSQVMHIPKRDLVKDTHSPMRDKYPKGVDLPLSEIVKYMVAESDNNACDFLLKTIGGTKTVQDYMLHIGIKGIAIRASEADMASMWELQYTNWCKPVEMTTLLDRFYRGKILAKSTTDTLYKIMTETTTGPNRLKGLLPSGTVVAHKTGTSPTNAEGLSPATNDVGIITLPNGKHLVISVFVCNSTNDEATREGVISKIAKAAFDYYGK